MVPRRVGSKSERHARFVAKAATESRLPLAAEGSRADEAGVSDGIHNPRAGASSRAGRDHQRRSFSARRT
jgi:hypothetical protein